MKCQNMGCDLSASGEMNRLRVSLSAENTGFTSTDSVRSPPRVRDPFEEYSVRIIVMKIVVMIILRLSTSSHCASSIGNVDGKGR